jgi:metal-dependent amidase/aminoacylase/carboxypeptidase family protein
MSSVLSKIKLLKSKEGHQNVAKTSVHSPTFIADEDAIPVGVTLMSAVILDYLKK